MRVRTIRAGQIRAGEATAAAPTYYFVDVPNAKENTYEKVEQHV
jgi:hypothetical protein